MVVSYSHKDLCIILDSIVEQAERTGFEICSGSSFRWNGRHGWEVLSGYGSTFGRLFVCRRRSSTEFEPISVVVCLGVCDLSVSGCVVDIHRPTLCIADKD